MARGRPQSSPDGSALPVLLAIVCCASFSLGVMTAPAGKASGTFAQSVKTEARALPDGVDFGGGSWVGLNDPSIGQTALIENRLAARKAPVLTVARNAPSEGY